MRRLIVNADDFGLTAGVNRAITEAHTAGIVTSATLMANGNAFEDAVRVAASSPRLSIGCHVVLVDGSPVLPASQVPSLIQREPRFYESSGQFAMAALSGRFEQGELEAEIEAQIRKIQASGLAVSHVDTHKHMHIFPQVLRPLLRAIERCGIRALRNPFELIRLQQFSRPAAWKRSIQTGLLRSFAGKFRRAVRDAGMLTPDGTLGIVATGGLDESLFEELAKTMPPGTWEFVCHPGYNDADLGNVRTRLRQSRETELNILTSPKTRDLLARQGIELISYRDLADMGGGANPRP